MSRPLPAAIDKRLATLRQARSFVDWQRRPALVKDLDLQRELVKRWQPADDQAEKLVAKRLLAHLERCGWEFGHRPLGR